MSCFYEPNPGDTITVHSDTPAEKSYIESLVALVTEVALPQASGAAVRTPPLIREANFFELTCDVCNFTEEAGTTCSGAPRPALLLVLCCSHCTQIWLVAPDETVQLLVSTPRLISHPRLLSCSWKWPKPTDHRSRLAFGEENSRASVKVASLVTGSDIKELKFDSEVTDIQSSEEFVIISLRSRCFYVHDNHSLVQLRHVSNCIVSPEDGLPLALAANWVAYADARLVSHLKSKGGLKCDDLRSHALGSALYSLGHQLTSSPTKYTGTITVLDLARSNDSKSPAIIAHFQASETGTVSMLEFNPSGSLLLACDSAGQFFNIFNILPHPAGSVESVVHHLYTLVRGSTPGAVQSASFSRDSRWLAVSTRRGTTHLFAITPYHAPATVRTHCRLHLPNKFSRYHQSAGLARLDAEQRQADNQRLPPFAPALVENPVAQLKQTLSLPPLGSATSHLVSSLFLRRSVTDGSCSLLLFCWLGHLLQYRLEPHVARGAARDKNSAITATVQATHQWNICQHADKLTNSPSMMLLAEVFSSSSGNANTATSPRRVVPMKGSWSEDWINEVEIFTCQSRKLWQRPNVSTRCYSTSSLHVSSPSLTTPTSSAVLSASSWPGESSSVPLNIIATTPGRQRHSSSPSVSQYSSFTYYNYDGPHLDVYSSSLETTTSDIDRELFNSLAEARLEQSPSVDNLRPSTGHSN